MYITKKKDSKIYGAGLETAIKQALKRSNPDAMSPAGEADFRFMHRNYDVKQNGSPITYDGQHYVKGSNRVIYALHVAATLIDVDAERVGIEVDLGATELYCVDKTAFVKFLLDNGLAKTNKTRGNQINIQSLYNYKKQCYHGTKWQVVEEWLKANELEDPAIQAIWDTL